MIEQFVQFIVARHAVYVAREAGEPGPWSNDPILQHYKFCNVYRELDRVTRWVTTHWREPHKDDADLWFALLIARRCINRPATLAEIGFPVPWDAASFLAALARCKKPIFNSEPYKLILTGLSGDLGERQVEFLLNPLWEVREKFRPHSEDTLQTFHDRLAAVRFMGGFFAAQVVADLKYVGQLRKATDWAEFAASGPGSRRGLNRVLGRPADSSWKESEWGEQLHSLRKTIAPMLDKSGLPEMHAQDTQNCLCEFDKYERIRLNEGKGRKFVPNCLDTQPGFRPFVPPPMVPSRDRMTSGRQHEEVQRKAEQISQRDRIVPTPEFIAKLAAEWARILPKAPAADWASLLTTHSRLAQADWEGLLSRIEHNRRPITVSYENYLKRCVYDVEDKLKQVHTFPAVPGEDELA